MNNRVDGGNSLRGMRSGFSADHALRINVSASRLTHE